MARGRTFFGYKVCNDPGGFGNCVPSQDLSHIDIVLPNLDECLTDQQEISVKQDGCLSCDPVLACSLEDRDASCGINPSQRVVRCDIVEGTLDTGECVVIKVEIAGEVPMLGPGTIDVVTSDGNTCASDPR